MVVIIVIIRTSQYLLYLEAREGKCRVHFSLILFFNIFFLFQCKRVLPTHPHSCHMPHATRNTDANVHASKSYDVPPDGNAVNAEPFVKIPIDFVLWVLQLMPWSWFNRPLFKRP